VLLSGPFADTPFGGARADGPEAEGKGKSGAARQDAGMDLPPQGWYASDSYHWSRTLQVNDDEYVLQRFRLPEERGQLRRSKGRVYLRPEDRKTGRAWELVHIPWGERSYLVEPDELIWFCNEVNLGEEPRNERDGFFYLRDGDSEKQVKGQPRVPEEVRDYILPKPIVAKVVRVMPYEKNVRIKGRPILEEGYPVLIERGRKDGVRPGMRFEWEGEYNWIIAYVTSADDSSSTLLAHWLSTSKDKIEPGILLSTRRGDGLEKNKAKDK
jgi:hypothetical protein